MQRNWIFDNMNPVIIKWELFVILLAVYSSIILPLEIAFKPPTLDNKNFKLINHLIDLLFLIDLIITFRTTQINIMTGEIITDPKQIAKNYVAGRFWIDLISTIPFEELVIIFIKMEDKDLKKFVLLSCLKLIRVLRLSRLIDFLN
jgi:hypothetical protein